MYVTRPLALYKSYPELLSIQPASVEGPGSGYIVVHDDTDVESGLKNLPFPQNKLITKINSYTSHGYYASSSRRYYKEYHVAFIPVINQPLSSNCYYVIVADTSLKGLVYSSALKKGTEVSCFCYTNILDKEPEEFNPYNIYQQFEIFKTTEGCFSARSVDPEAFPPELLRKQGKLIHSSKHRKLPLGEAEGLNSSLRSQLPDFSFSLSSEHSQSKTVGKWYCPFMFVEEGSLKEQVERSMFYELTLEQQWERIYLCERDSDEVGSESVAVNVVVPTESVKISWMDAVCERDEAKNMMWFWVVSELGLQTRVGLSLVIVERMMWEQERVGWVGGDEKQVMVARMERCSGGDLWRKFGCYVLVERFVLKRLDGSLVLTYEFKHTHRIKCKWE